MSEMRMMLAAVMGFSLTAACQPEAAPVDTAAPEAIEMPTVEPAQATLVTTIGGVDLAQPMRALGTEPFWGVEIKPDELVFTGVDRPELRFANPGAVREGDAAVIKATDTTGVDLVVTLRAAECSDGMSDRVYPLEAEVKLGAETLKGCAASQAMLDAEPRP